MQEGGQHRPQQEPGPGNQQLGQEEPHRPPGTSQGTTFQGPAFWLWQLQALPLLQQFLQAPFQFIAGCFKDFFLQRGTVNDVQKHHPPAALALGCTFQKRPFFPTGGFAGRTDTRARVVLGHPQEAQSGSACPALAQAPPLEATGKPNLAQSGPAGRCHSQPVPTIAPLQVMLESGSPVQGKGLGEEGGAFWLNPTCSATVDSPTAPKWGQTSPQGAQRQVVPNTSLV